MTSDELKVLVPVHESPARGHYARLRDPALLASIAQDGAVFWLGCPGYIDA